MSSSGLDGIIYFCPNIGLQPSAIDGAIAFKNVEFAYPSNPASHVLKGVSFDIPAGKSLAVVGPSGSGKSTIASLLLHLYSHTGEITIDGNPIQQ